LSDNTTQIEKSNFTLDTFFARATASMGSSDGWIDTSNEGVVIEADVSGLMSGTQYYLRVRLTFRLVTQNGYNPNIGHLSYIRHEQQKY